MSEGPLLILDADHKPVRNNIGQLSDTLQRDQYRNLPLKVVSVAGMMRIGKSTTMNLFMRQLRAHEATRQPIDELDGSLKSDTDLSGFPWGGGVESVTHGVYIWSRPFIVSDGNGSESAVLLMDVEGAFDGATIMESAPIFVFAALVSSAVLLNVEGNIDESVIQLLDYFVATGNTILQDATIVVRNFTLAQTFGFEPGNELLKKKMKATDPMNEAMRTSRGRIRQFAPNLSCFLMPNPGLEAAEQNDWRDARPEFLSCTRDLLCATIRHPKLVGEQPLKCADFVAFMEPFFRVFDRDQYPPSTTLFDALRESTNLVACRQAEDGYRRDIRALANEIGLENAHRRLQAIAIGHLQHVQPPEVCERLTTELKERLEEIKADQGKMETQDKQLKIVTGVIAAVGVVGVAVLILTRPAIAPAVVPAMEAVRGALATGRTKTIVETIVTTIAAAAVAAAAEAAPATAEVNTQKRKDEQEEKTK